MDTTIKIIIGVIIAFLIFCVFSFFISINNRRIYFRENAPCSELSSWSIESLPARCLNYYGVSNK